MREIDEEEYWSWVSVLLFITIVLDLLTTLFATHTVGSNREANLIMRKILKADASGIIAVHVLAVVTVSVLFHLIYKTYDAMSDSHYRDIYGSAIEAFIGTIIALGLFVFANNLLVIFFVGLS